MISWSELLESVNARILSYGYLYLSGNGAGVKGLPPRFKVLDSVGGSFFSGTFPVSVAGPGSDEAVVVVVCSVVAVAASVVTVEVVSGLRAAPGSGVSAQEVAAKRTTVSDMHIAKERFFITAAPLYIRA